MYSVNPHILDVNSHTLCVNSHVVFEEFPVAGTKMTFDFYDCLKDLPYKSVGLVSGSSGVGNNRFIATNS